jgi:protein-disulfide isomerase
MARKSRRALLRGLSVGAAVGLAGCLGALGGGDDGPEGDGLGNETMGTDPTTAATTTAGESTPLVGGGPVDRNSVEEMPAPVAGDPEADVTVMSFEDYACPHCATYSLEVLPDVRAEYIEPGTIRYEQHDYPIPVSQFSFGAAVAGRSVQDRVGNEAYFTYADEVFKNQRGLDYDAIRAAADAAGADGEAVVEDARNDVYRPVVEADRSRGERLGVRGTPTVFVDGESVSPTYDSIASAIDVATA